LSAETKQLFAMLEGMQREDGKRQVRHGDFAAESGRVIFVGMDRVVFGFQGQFPRLEEGSGSWVLFCADGKLKTEN
jgi:hypothetical protein